VIVPTPTNVFHLKLSVANAREILRVAAALDLDEDGNRVVIITAYYL